MTETQILDLRNNSREQAMNTAATAVQQRVQETVGSITNAAGTRDVFRAMTAIDTAVQTAVEASKQYAADDLIPAAGRQRVIDEAVQAAREAVVEAEAQAEVALEVLRSELIVKAFPEPTGATGTSARLDADIVLRNASNYYDALTTLAQDSDPAIRALAAGPWGQRALAAQGQADRHQRIVERALDTEARSGTGERAKAAASLSKLGGARAAVAGQRSLARSDLDRIAADAQRIIGAAQ